MGRSAGGAGFGGGGVLEGRLPEGMDSGRGGECQGRAASVGDVWRWRRGRVQGTLCCRSGSRGPGARLRGLLVAGPGPVCWARAGCAGRSGAGCPSPSGLRRAVPGARELSAWVADREDGTRSGMRVLAGVWQFIRLRFTLLLNTPRQQRKRNWFIENSSFLEERPQQSRRTNLKTGEAAASLSKAWLKCGEGFQDTSESLSLASEKTATTEKPLELSPSSKKEAAGQSPSELADITWSSSGSDFSDEDKALPQIQRDGRCDYRAGFCSSTVSCPEYGATEDELQVIDWEINSDVEDPCGPSECEDGEGALEISDCASCASGHSLTDADRLCEPPEPISTEILEYSSDSDKEDDPKNDLFIDSESPHKYQVDFKSDARQSLNRQPDSGANSTQPILSTPQKYMAKFSKTTENSATKKKFLRGGLAERLKELQNRERSAISLWRHRCVSYKMTPLGRKSGVLTVKILELHEECAMQVALCEQLSGPPTTSPPRGVAPRLGACLKVLFTRETADHLRGQPQDIIYIFPPW
ncbi:scaffolding protein involved in DNA repair [Cricetulus griseus]